MIEHKETNKEIVKRWGKGKLISTVELGGLGPGYEQALQNALFKMFSYLTKKKIPKEKLTKGKKYSKWYDKLTFRVWKGMDLSGAMAGAAQSTAYQFHVYGYSHMMNKAPEDRIILIDNCEIIKKK